MSHQPAESEPWTPGPGWREVPRPVAAAAPEAIVHRAPKGTDDRIRAWVPNTQPAEPDTDA